MMEENYYEKKMKWLREKKSLIRRISGYGKNGRTSANVSYGFQLLQLLTNNFKF